MSVAQAFHTKVAGVIGRHSLLEPGQRVIAGVSGGPDSVAMLLTLQALGYNVLAAHCNFSLRGRESDGDDLFVERLCSEHGIQLERVRFDAAARSHECHISVEMACRELRYNWFDGLRLKHGIDTIAVAHNRQDRVETFFLNLMRASGEAGLRGIKHKNGRIVRPLLNCSREEILAYLADRGLDYRIDSSNASDAYARNRLRNHVLPALRQAFPQADELVISTIKHLAEGERLMAHFMSGLEREYVTPGGHVLVKLLASREPMASAVLYRLLKPRGFNRSASDNILRAAGESGRVFHTPAATWLLDRGALRPLRDREADTVRLDIDAPDGNIGAGLHLARIDRADFHPRRDPNVIWLDARALADSPVFEVRPWRPGDRIKPFGLADGSRLVSDILTDAHVPLDDKPAVRVLTRNGVIIWVIGHRPSRHFPFTPTTPTILRLTTIP